MSATQIILLLLGLYIVYSYVRKFAISRKINHYSASEAKEKIKNPSYILLDVRTDKERKSGSIRCSVHIPIGQLKSKLGDLNKYKNKEIICFCRTGSRSLTAASILYKAGFNAANMKGGIVTWNFSNKK
ncbi:MAG: rhodanese-like domain-containing protein [Ignavibacteriaceae bacterium]